MSQIRPLADIVHFKYAHTYLLTKIMITKLKLSVNDRLIRSA